MDYALIALTTLAQIAPPGAFVTPKYEWKSAYTNLRTECLTEAEPGGSVDCKGFGPYRLTVAAGNPELRAGSRELTVESLRPLPPLAGGEVEWRYRRAEGEAATAAERVGFIYRGPAEGASAPKYIAIRLAGDRACALGEAREAEGARRLVEEAPASCPWAPPSS